MLLNLEAAREEISGQRLWEGSMLLCSHLLSTADNDSSSTVGESLLRGKRVLELGAGCGVVGMLCVRLGAAQVVITDGDAR
jgi:protein-lysine N-methyltransferase EEF2KMT